MSKNTFLYGLLGGLFMVAFSLIIYLINPLLYASFGMLAVMVLVMFAVLLFIGFALRKAEGGYINLGKAFVSLLISGLIITLVNSVYSILLYNVIDPQLPELLTEEIFDKLMGWFERMDVPLDELEEQMEESRRETAKRFSTVGVLLSIPQSLIGWAIGSLIVGAIVKRKPKEELQDFA